jgi:hypothetical protein
VCYDYLDDLGGRVRLQFDFQGGVVKAAQVMSLPDPGGEGRSSLGRIASVCNIFWIVLVTPCVTPSSAHPHPSILSRVDRSVTAAFNSMPQSQPFASKLRLLFSPLQLMAATSGTSSRDHHHPWSLVASTKRWCCPRSKTATSSAS